MNTPLDFADCKILVLGDIILDRYIDGEIARISPEAPVPVLKKEKTFSRLGGAGNVAANLAGIGSPCFLISVSGNDAIRFELQALLQEGGIDHYLYADSGRATISKTRILSGQHHLLRIDEENTHALTQEAEKAILAEFSKTLPDCKAVIISDYGKGICTPAVCREVIRMSRSSQIPVFVDPKGTDWSKYQGAACITPNLAEFSAVTAGRMETPEDLAAEGQALCARLGLERLLITLGVKGMQLVGPSGENQAVKARTKLVFDVSGAGDTVISALAACRAVEMGWRAAMETANLAAGIVVGKVGTQPAYLEEIQEELRTEQEGHRLKIKTLDEAAQKISLWRRDGESIVFTNGCFDLLHPGHVHLLRQAAALGGKLVVGLNSDASVVRLKGAGRPVLNQGDRSTLLASLQDVDLVVIFEEDTPLRLIETLQPDILVKGGDYSKETVVGAELVETWGGHVALVELKAGIGTTDIINRIHGSGD